MFGLVYGQPRRMWFGVKASRSWGSSHTWVKGLLLITDSISANNVTSDSSVSVRSFTIIHNAFFVSITIDSIAPSFQGAIGGLNFHSIPSLRRYEDTFSLLSSEYLFCPNKVFSVVTPD